MNNPSLMQWENANDDDNEHTAFEFEDAYAGRAASTVHRPVLKRKGLWVACFAPPLADEHAHVSSPPKLLPSRLAVTSTELLYSATGNAGQLRVPLADIENAVYKRITAGGASVNKVTITFRNSAKEPLHIRGLKEPQKLLDLLAERRKELQSRPEPKQDGPAVPLGAPEGEAPVRTATVPSNAAKPGAKRNTARALFPDLPPSPAAVAAVAASPGGASSCGSMTHLSPFASSPAQQFAAMASATARAKALSAKGGAEPSTPPASSGHNGAGPQRPAASNSPQSSAAVKSPHPGAGPSLLPPPPTVSESFLGSAPPSAAVASPQPSPQLMSPTPPVVSPSGSLPADAATKRHAPLLSPGASPAHPPAPQTAGGAPPPTAEDSVMGGSLRSLTPSPHSMPWAAGSPPPVPEDSVMAGASPQLSNLGSTASWEGGSAVHGSAVRGGGHTALQLEASLSPVPTPGPSGGMHGQEYLASPPHGSLPLPQQCTRDAAGDAHGAGPLTAADAAVEAAMHRSTHDASSPPTARDLEFQPAAGSGRRHRLSISSLADPQAADVAGVETGAYLLGQLPRASEAGASSFRSAHSTNLLASSSAVGTPPALSRQGSGAAEAALQVGTGSPSSSGGDQRSPPRQPRGHGSSGGADGDRAERELLYGGRGSPEGRGTTAMGALGIAAAAATMSAVLTSAASATIGSIGSLAAAPSLGSAASLAAGGAAAAASVAAAPLSLMGITAAAAVTMMAAAAVTHMRTGSPMQPLADVVGRDVQEARALVLASASRFAEPPSPAYSPTVARYFSVGPHPPAAGNGEAGAALDWTPTRSKQAAPFLGGQAGAEDALGDAGSQDELRASADYQEARPGPEEEPGMEVPLLPAGISRGHEPITAVEVVSTPEAVPWAGLVTRRRLLFSGSGSTTGGSGGGNAIGTGVGGEGASNGSDGGASSHACLSQTASMDAQPSVELQPAMRGAPAGPAPGAELPHVPTSEGPAAARSREGSPAASDAHGVSSGDDSPRAGTRSMQQQQTNPAASPQEEEQAPVMSSNGPTGTQPLGSCPVDAAHAPGPFSGARVVQQRPIRAHAGMEPVAAGHAPCHAGIKESDEGQEVYVAAAAVIHGGELLPPPDALLEMHPIVSAAAEVQPGTQDPWWHEAQCQTKDRAPKDLAARQLLGSGLGTQASISPNTDGVQPARNARSATLSHWAALKGTTFEPTPAARLRRPPQLSESPVRVLFSVPAASPHQLNEGQVDRPVTCESSVQTDALQMPVTESAVQTDLALAADGFAAVRVEWSSGSLPSQGPWAAHRRSSVGSPCCARAGEPDGGGVSDALSGASSDGGRSGGSGRRRSPALSASVAQRVYSMDSPGGSVSGSTGPAALEEQQESPELMSGARDWYMSTLDAQHLRQGDHGLQPTDAFEGPGMYSRGSSRASSCYRSLSHGASSGQTLAERYDAILRPENYLHSTHANSSEASTPAGSVAAVPSPRHPPEADVSAASPLSEDRKPLLGNTAVAPHRPGINAAADKVHLEAGNSFSEGTDSGSGSSSEPSSPSISSRTPSSVTSGLYTPVASELGSGQPGASTSCGHGRSGLERGLLDTAGSSSVGAVTAGASPGGTDGDARLPLLSPGVGLSAEPATPPGLRGSLLAEDDADSFASRAFANGGDVLGIQRSAVRQPTLLRTAEEDAAGDMVWLLGPMEGSADLGGDGDDGQASAAASTAVSPHAPSQGPNSGRWTFELFPGAPSEAAARAPISRQSSTGSCPGAAFAAPRSAEPTAFPVTFSDEQTLAAGNQLAVPVPPISTPARADDEDGGAQTPKPASAGSTALAPGSTGASSHGQGEASCAPTEAVLAFLGAAGLAAAMTAIATGGRGSGMRAGSPGGPHDAGAAPWDGPSQALPSSPGMSDISSEAQGGAFYMYASSPGPSPFGTPAPAPRRAVAAAHRRGNGAGGGDAVSSSPESEDFFRNPLFISPAHGAGGAGARITAREDSSGAISLPMAPYGAAFSDVGLHGEASGASSQAPSGFVASPPSVSTEGPTRTSSRRRSRQRPTTSYHSRVLDPQAPRRQSGGSAESRPEGRAPAAAAGGSAAVVGSSAADSSAAGRRPHSNSGSGSGLQGAAAAGSRHRASAGGSSEGSDATSPPRQRKRARTRVPEGLLPVAGGSGDSGDVAARPAPAGRQRPRRRAAPGPRPDVLMHLASPIMVLNPAYSQSTASSGSAAASPHADGADSGPVASAARGVGEGHQPHMQVPVPVPAVSEVAAGSEAPRTEAAPAAAQAALPEHGGEEASVSVGVSGPADGAGGCQGAGTPSSHLTPRERLLAGISNSPLSIGSWQSSPTSQQAAHAAALLRNANDAVDCAREAVQRGDTEWLARVTATLHAVQSAIEALREF